MVSRREFLSTATVSAWLIPAKCSGAKSLQGPVNGYIRTVRELEQACRAGGRYQLMPGTYVLGDKVLLPVSGTHLVGSPGRTVLQKSTSAGPYRLRAFFDIEDARSVTLEGLILDHQAKRTEHGLIVRASAPGASSGIAMRNCELRRCHVHIERFVENVEIMDTRFMGDGVALAGIATGGQISKSDGKGINSDGATRNIRLERLYFERTISEAIDINWHTRDVVAKSIRAYNCDLGGQDEVIDIGGDVNTTEANDCRNILFDGVIIHNDNAGPSSSVGIQVKGRSRSVRLRNIKISRRNGTGRTVGLRLWNTLATSVEGMNVNGCTYGIILAASGQRPPSGISLKKVNVRNYREDAIQLEGAGVTLDGFEVEGGGSAGVGLDLLALDNATIRNGRIRNGGMVGVRARQSASRTLIEGVTVNGASSGPAFDLRSRDVRVIRP